jgi:hypothetical protein
VLDQTSYQKDRLRDTGRWGYTGDLIDEPMPVEESSGMGRWFVWAIVIALVVVALVMLSGALAG